MTEFDQQTQRSFLKGQDQAKQYNPVYPVNSSLRREYDQRPIFNTPNENSLALVFF